jgi:hypothetical protein
LGTSYTARQPEGTFFVWTDVFPNPQRADVDGEYGPSPDDRITILDYVEEHDEDDQLDDGSVRVPNFGPEFVVFDVNQNGRVDAVDALLVTPVGDDDNDGDVDLGDYAHFQACASFESLTGNPSCALDDLDADGEVAMSDYLWFAQLLSGP